jgi:hypothetical protein
MVVMSHYCILMVFHVFLLIFLNVVKNKKKREKQKEILA